MKKRLASALLWFYAGWTFGSFAAFVFGGSELVGPVVGAAAAAIIAGDPRHLIWVNRHATVSTPHEARAVQTPA